MKYTITMSCGHEEQINLFGKSEERDRKIEYLKSIGLCKECYKKKMQEKAEKEGFNFEASVLPHINNADGSILLSVWFSGNTKSYKEEIKSLGGYKWSTRDDYNLTTDFVSMCWNKIIKLSELKDEAMKATSIGATCIVYEENLHDMMNYHIALEQQKKWNKKNDMIKSIEKPIVPEVLKGCRWNQKIYGKPGSYTIYLDGNKVSITNVQKDEIENYLNLKKEYKSKVDAIEV